MKPSKESSSNKNTYKSITDKLKAVKVMTFKDWLFEIESLIDDLK